MKLYNTLFVGRNPLVWLLCFVILVLAGCAQVGEEVARKAPKPLVYPEPPDEPRFVFERMIRGSSDVEVQSEDSKLKNLLLGDTKSFGQGMGKPYGIAANKGRIYVADTAKRDIKVFDIPESRFFTIGQGPDLKLTEKLQKPIGISAAANGDLYIADATAKFIMVYDRDGKFLRKFGGPDFFDKLASVKVDKEGKRAYAVDIAGVESTNHRVRVFDAQTGKLLFDIGHRGSGSGEFNLPRAVAIGKDKLYVVDGGNFRIQVFDMEGKFIKTFGDIGKQMGSFGRPKEADTDADGNVYVIDTSFGNFQIFNPEGQLLMFVGQRGDSGPGNFSLPAGITVDENGRVYVTDQVLDNVQVFRPFKLGEQEGYLVRKPGTK